MTILLNNGSLDEADGFLSHLLSPDDGGRLGWGWTSWTLFPPPESSPTVEGGVIFSLNWGSIIDIYKSNVRLID
jgi:hypothetical protein